MTDSVKTELIWDQQPDYRYKPSSLGTNFYG